MPEQYPDLGYLDKTIRHLIVLLNLCGYGTYTSCSGVVSEHERDSESISTPYMCFRSNKKSPKMEKIKHIFEKEGFIEVRKGIGKRPCFYMRRGIPVHDYDNLFEAEPIIVENWNNVYVSVLKHCLRK